jgi:hypothetical protein
MELTIPDEYKMTTNGELFLLYVSFSVNIEENRILIFSKEKKFQFINRK